MARYKNLRSLLRCPATSFPSLPSTSMDALNRRPPGETVGDSGQLCSVCLQRCEKYRRCSICKLVAYCGTECQRAD
ncbi:hypothetical protein PENSPDRAFT_64961 [Peniophora sp. CONT]|nr:hypothetical protein PENSPDRAFT_64961 [Peniophora sp. CONT]